jgi:hypothetical protein
MGNLTFIIISSDSAFLLIFGEDLVCRVESIIFLLPLPCSLVVEFVFQPNIVEALLFDFEGLFRSSKVDAPYICQFLMTM